MGDLIEVKGAYGTGGVELANSFAWFEGYLLQPENNTITSTTDLTINSLTATATTNDIDLRNNITAGNNITLTQTGNVT